MKMQENTILITGGGSGIGRGLAEAFHRLGNQVIISGRRSQMLAEVTAANPGMHAVTFDAADAASIRQLGQTMREQFSAFNVLLNNAGIQKPEMLLQQPEELTDVEAMITTNLLGPIRLTAALLPQLQGQKNATILNVTSGLAFLPGAFVPTYSATKAAMHAYTLSLRYQLKGKIDVLEVIPPYVQTDLGPNHSKDSRAMPLNEFIEENMAILQNDPGSTEIVVDRCKPLRFAVESGNFQKVFEGLNKAMS